MSFFTSCWLLPQKEQYSVFSLVVPFLSAMPCLPLCEDQGRLDITSSTRP